MVTKNKKKTFLFLFSTETMKKLTNLQKNFIRELNINLVFK